MKSEIHNTIGAVAGGATAGQGLAYQLAEHTSMIASICTISTLGIYASTVIFDRWDEITVRLTNAYRKFRSKFSRKK